MSIGAARELAERLGVDRVLVSGPEYQRASRVWNDAVRRRPAVVVRPASAAQVRTAVLVAREHGLALSVKGGGHDWAGRALNDGGLVVDLGGLREVTVDAGARVATVEGGATVRDVIAAAAPHGLLAVGGTVGGVGMAGLTLGGGYGPLVGRLGLAADNLLGATVVLADGRIVTADATAEPDLFWALRGGGGNFGVVTALRVRLHPVPRLVTGFALHAWPGAAAVLARLGDLLATAPDELTVPSGVISGPDGGPAVFLSPTWCGDEAAGGPVLDEVLGLGAPVVAERSPVTYHDLLARFEPYAAGGRHHEMRTRSLPGYTAGAIEALVAAGEARTSPLSGVVVHHFHGAAARVPDDATAFGNRRDHLMVEIGAVWEPDDPAAPHRAWTEEVWSALSGVALPGGYPSLLAPGDRDQIAHAYGDNAARLKGVKAHYDPHGVFTATPLPF
ncbi:FAD-binding oxidoreductase [Phytohabitans kaempferiae]|uniref:FAD-binding oxidoreductase n=1 Tax=Phytohabitans kaempferiae TaxID=1620943 RepID=A0ABV6LYQ1_9ACTN